MILLLSSCVTIGEAKKTAKAAYFAGQVDAYDYANVYRFMVSDGEFFDLINGRVALARTGFFILEGKEYEKIDVDKIFETDLRREK
jgi:hypothetical protein